MKKQTYVPTGKPRGRPTKFKTEPIETFNDNVSKSNVKDEYDETKAETWIEKYLKSNNIAVTEIVLRMIVSIDSWKKNIQNPFEQANFFY